MSVTFPLAIAMASLLMMHPVHETVCEVQWNPQTRRVEVALRLDLLDEQWLKKQVDGESEPQWQLAVLKSRLFFDPVVVTPVSGSEVGTMTSGRPLEWVGRKEDGGHVWWFFEVICEDGKPPTSIQTRLLFDRHRDYQHSLVVLGIEVPEGAKRPSILLSLQAPKAPLKLFAP